MKLKTFSPLLFLTPLANTQPSRPNNKTIDFTEQKDGHDYGIKLSNSREKIKHLISNATLNQLYFSGKNALPSKTIYTYNKEDNTSTINFVEEILHSSDSSDKKLEQLLKKTNGETLFRSAVNNNDLETVNSILNKIIHSDSFTKNQLNVIFDEVKPNLRVDFLPYASTKVISAEVYDPNKVDEDIERFLNLSAMGVTAAVIGYTVYQRLQQD